MLDQLGDGELMALVAGNDLKAMGVLVERHWRKLRTFLLEKGASPVDVEDVIQDSWVRVHKSVESYDDQLPFFAWLQQIALNRLRSVAGRERLETDSLDAIEDAEEIEGDVPTPETLYETEERRALVRYHIHSLPEPFAETLYMRYVEERSAPECAERLGIPIGTVHSRCFVGMRMLRERMEELEP